MRFKVRIANNGGVYAVFDTWTDYFLSCWLFDDEQTVTDFIGYAAAIKIPAWRKDSFRDAAIHG